MFLLEKEEIIGRLKVIEKNIEALTIEVTPEEIKEQMPELAEDADRQFIRGFIYAKEAIPRALSDAKSLKLKKEIAERIEGVE